MVSTMVEMRAPVKPRVELMAYVSVKFLLFYFVCFRFVVTMDDEAQPMRVKLMCCKRPDIKPIALRQLLANLCNSIFKDLSSSENYQLSIAK